MSATRESTEESLMKRGRGEGGGNHCQHWSNVLAWKGRGLLVEFMFTGKMIISKWLPFFCNRFKYSIIFT